jgi:hypothetical protein
MNIRRRLHESPPLQERKGGPATRRCPVTVGWVVRITEQAGGPFKPFFGLSGALRVERVFLPLFLASALSIRIQSPLSLRNPSCTGENCSTPSPLHARTGRASPGCDEYIEAFPQTEIHCEH